LVQAHLDSRLRNEAVSTEIEHAAETGPASPALPGPERASSGGDDLAVLAMPGGPRTPLGAIEGDDLTAFGAVSAAASAAALIPVAAASPPSAAETAAPDPNAPPASAIIELSDEFRIQLAALDSEVKVGSMWDGFVTEFEALVRGLERYVVKMKSASGTLYLVQAGPFEDLQQALGKCDELNRQGADCVVVRRLRLARAPAPQVSG
jgi:cell division septation protein DedD